MSLLSDLLDFVKSREPDGASFSEIQGYLEMEDKVEVRNLISEAFDKNYIFKQGEKRATRYRSRSGVVVPQEDNDDVPVVDNKALEVYLNDATPVHDAVITHVENIVKIKDAVKLCDFIKNGRKITTYVISYDHEKKKNVVVDTTTMTRMNYFSIRGKEAIIEKYDQVNGTKEIIECGDYESLRDELRILLTK